MVADEDLHVCRAVGAAPGGENALQSVLIAMVLHATNNAVSGEYFSPMFTGADSVRQNWLLVLVWGIAFMVANFTHVFRVAPRG